MCVGITKGGWGSRTFWLQDGVGGRANNRCSIQMKREKRRGADGQISTWRPEGSLDFLSGSPGNSSVLVVTCSTLRTRLLARSALVATQKCMLMSVPY